ncbi:hypothetical protein B5M09_000653 [Aphanomyces astaci]|uniref:Serine/threonine specific protein phosphatases domain-containing protein n=1 Tax=Aphanomyces astaci TaxID=112090 RepID=A0A425CS15_APHAT|nr:hypothetical protein B5M09_000653 [Aphanomyces astaci]
MDTKREIGPTLVLSPAKQSSLRSPWARRPVSPRPAAAAVATSTSETISFLSSGALQCSSQCGHQQALQLLEIKVRLRDQLAELHLLHGEPKEKVKIPRAVTPAVFSVTDEGTKARSITTSMGRHVSIATGHVLRSIPKQVPNRVAERVSEVPSPVYVIGDIHGNLSDLKFFSDHLWRLGIGLTAGNFLFLGDYVDRGLSSLECIAYLFAQKVNNAFDCMPVSAVIDDDIFCAHGGIPRPLASGEKQLDSIQSVGEMTLDKHGFGKSARGGNSICFGNVAIDDFLQRHNFSYIIRAHEACSQGIHLSKSARVLTVFSTSKDHGLGKRAKCGCLLVERDRILILNRSHKYNGGFVRRRSSLQLSSSLLPQPDGGLSSTSAAARRCSAASSGGEHANEDDHEDEDSTDDEVDDTKALDGPTGIMANSQVVIDLGDNNQEET